MMRSLIAALVLGVACGVIGAQETEEPGTWESKRGFYRVSYESSIDPIEINQLHEWVVHIETTDGMPVEGAVLNVAGGMPEHDHGLPTRPRVTAELGEGDYRLQGLRFHMDGAWAIEIEIAAGNRRDSVTILLEL